MGRPSPTIGFDISFNVRPDLLVPSAQLLAAKAEQGNAQFSIVPADQQPDKLAGRITFTSELTEGAPTRELLNNFIASLPTVTNLTVGELAEDEPEPIEIIKALAFGARLLEEG